MKIQLDTDNKTIKLESEVKLSKLIETLEKLLPNNEWKTFTLQTNTVINNWASPIAIHDHYPRPYWQPWYTRPMYVSKTVEHSVGLNTTNGLKATSQNILNLKGGVFNVEV